MKRQIIIHLGPSHPGNLNGEQVSWVVVDATAPKASVYQGDLHTASNHAVGCRVVVMVSALDVLLTQVELPNMNKQRLMKAVPYALEEQVASDVEELHFALGLHDEQQQLTCAVVERNTADDWLKRLKDAGIQADVLTTEFFGVKQEDDCWTIALDNMSGERDKLVLRTGEQTGMALEGANLFIVLRTLLESMEPEERPNQLRFIQCEEPVRTQCLVSDTEANLVDVNELNTEVEDPTVLAMDASNVPDTTELLENLGALCDEFFMELDVQHQDDSYLYYLSQRFEDKNCINLLQGEYSRIEQLGKIFKPWIAPAVIASVWLFLQAGLIFVDYLDLSKKDTALRAEIESVYRDAFPDAKKVVNPKVQMERGLEKLRSGGDSQGDIFPILSKAGKVLSNSETLSLRSIRYKNEKMDIEFEIKDLQLLDALKLQLANEAGLEVEILSASARDGKVESRMQLKVAKTK